MPYVYPIIMFFPSLQICVTIASEPDRTFRDRWSALCVTVVMTCINSILLYGCLFLPPVTSLSVICLFILNIILNVTGVFQIIRLVSKSSKNPLA